MCWACTGKALNRIDLLGYNNLKSTQPTRKAVVLENKVSGLNTVDQVQMLLLLTNAPTSSEKFKK